jgi:hypothetical protein
MIPKCCTVIFVMQICGFLRLFRLHTVSNERRDVWSWPLTSNLAPRSTMRKAPFLYSPFLSLRERATVAYFEILSRYPTDKTGKSPKISLARAAGTLPGQEQNRKRWYCPLHYVAREAYNPSSYLTCLVKYRKTWEGMANSPFLEGTIRDWKLIIQISGIQPFLFAYPQIQFLFDFVPTKLLVYNSNYTYSIIYN